MAPSALIFPSGDRNNVLSASDPNWGSSLLLMPGAQIGMEDFQLIRRSLEHGPVTMQFELQNTTTRADAGEQRRRRDSRQRVA